MAAISSFFFFKFKVFNVPQIARNCSKMPQQDISYSASGWAAKHKNSSKMQVTMSFLLGPNNFDRHGVQSLDLRRKHFLNLEFRTAGQKVGVKMIEDPLQIQLQISVFYLARELTRSMLPFFRAALKMDGFYSVLCNPSIFSPGFSMSLSHAQTVGQI